MTIQPTAANGNSDVTLRVRGGDGRMRQTLTSAQRDAEAVRLYSDGLTYQQIADQLGLKNRADAYKMVKRTMAKVPVEAVDQLRKRQAGLIERLLVKTLEIMERDHIAHSQGRIVRIGCPGLDRGQVQHSGCTYGVPGAPYCDGPALLDHGPKLQAITVAKGLLERSAKLHGLDAPVRTAIEGDELVIRIKGVDTDAV